MIKNCYIIAEAGLNHNGSIEVAKKLIDASQSAGVDAVKFQKRTISLLATKEYLDKPDDRFPAFGNTYGEIRKFLEFDESQYIELKNYSKNRELDFIVTPFDNEAVEFLKKIGIDKYKLASHSLTNLDLIKKISDMDVETILSTGMAELNEIDTAVEIFKKRNIDNLSLLHCVSSYPTPLNECNINMIKFLKNRYNIKVGYSGHEIGYIPTLSAVALGAEIVERHFTLDKNLEGFDHKLSLEPEELKQMTKSIRDIELSLGSIKKSISNIEMITRQKYHVSMISKVFIKKGDILKKEMITYKNPGTGIAPKDEKKFLNKIIITEIKPDTILSKEMFENV